MDKVFQREQTVRFSDCDYTSHVKLSSLFLFMEECAVADAEWSGYGLHRLIGSGYALLISRQKLKMIHYPVEGERLIISTWVKRIEGKVAWRDFSIVDSLGRAVAHATTSWILVNLKTGRAVDFSEFPFPVEILPEKDALSDLLEVLLPGEAPKELGERKAHYSDLDLNCHVNHCRYVEWCLDAFSLEELRLHPIRSIQLNYLSQISFGEKTKIIRFADSTHHAKLFGVSGDDETIVRFQARIGF